ncbi:YheU family protein [Ketobacter alkanivorans]|nr:YheU family protein [Ketobacter alkanivorans]MCP5017019.1 YheU family protein [Ketobacter sp.]
MENMIEVPWDQLAADTLQALVEEFVSRDGTDYGEREIALAQKAEQVIHGIKRKQYVIVYDQEADSVQIVTAQDWKASGY